MSKRLVALLGLLTLVVLQCPSNNHLSGIQSGTKWIYAGTITFSIQNESLANNKIFTYTPQKAFSFKPTIAIGIQDFSLLNTDITLFNVQADQVTPSHIKFALAHRENHWSKLKINFWASTRPDITIGTHRSEFTQFKGITAIVSVYFNKPVAHYQKNPILRVFINGIESNRGTEMIDLAVSGRSLEEQKLTINIMAGPKFDLKTIWMSYMILVPRQSQFASYGGSIVKSDFEGESYKNVNKIMYSSDYKFYGLTVIKLSGSQPIALSTEIFNDLIIGISSSRPFDGFSIHFIIIGVSVGDSCSKCTQKYAYMNVCVAVCPSNTYRYSYRDGSIGCRTCSSRLNLVMNAAKTDCMCRKGSKAQNGVCVSQSPIIVNPSSPTVDPMILPQPIVGNHTYNINNCQNIQNTYWTGYRCACKVGFKNQTGSCIPLTLVKIRVYRSRQPTIVIDDVTNQTGGPGSQTGGPKNQTGGPKNQTGGPGGSGNPTIPIENPCYLPHEQFSRSVCICKEGYKRVNGICAQKIIENPNTNPPTGVTCPINSFLSNGNCICFEGYSKLQNVCVRNSGLSCGPNSFNNGLGVCVCKTNYHKNAVGQCIKGEPCPLRSTRQPDGQCVCDAGLTKYGNYCSKCPIGGLWSESARRCIFVCGENSRYDETANKCVCLQGFGLVHGVCQICPTNFFVSAGYCVTCPLNGIYNSVARKCDCKVGYLTSNTGFCVGKCNNNEEYNTNLHRCECINGLGKINGVCSICPSGSVPDSDGKCASCQVNQVNVNGACVCKNGYTMNDIKICTRCHLVPDTFEVNGRCAKCPSNLEYDGKTCVCPDGTKNIANKCQKSCRRDELIDNQGFCYSCPINQVILGGKCQCKTGYVKIKNQCTLQCPHGTFQYKGRCGVCPLDTVFKQQISGCACKVGFYLNNHGICEKITIKPIKCEDGFYFHNNKGCISCQFGCKMCESATVCTQCSQSGFAVVNGKCVEGCGDGLIVGSEQCDDKNRISGDGCSANCKRERFYFCSGQPSHCEYNGPVREQCGNSKIEGTQKCDDGKVANGDGCSSICKIEFGYKCSGQPSVCTKDANVATLELADKINANSNNVFIVLKTNPTFTFSNENERDNFMKSEFPDSLTPTVYCTQRVSPELQLFDCLLIYPSGLPNKQFNVKFSFDHEGKKASTTVLVNPLTTQFSIARSIRNRG